jgi:hypothetical protein
LYKGLRTVSRLSVTDFPDPKNPPATLEITGDLAGPREIKPKRVKLSADELKARREQRKAERANRPKPTLAEKMAQEQKKFEERMAKLKAKAEAKAEAEAKQGELVGA